MKIGLVLEGGGMRGLYTVGVLDCMMDRGFKADYVVGVSAGACNGVSYISGQRERGYKINTAYLGDKRYLSIQNFIKNKSMFGMDFIFDEIPHKLIPFNYNAFSASPIDFWTGVTDVETGKPVYFKKNAIFRGSNVLRASSAIPVFSPMVEIDNKKYLDGGTSDPIPVRKAIADGCDLVIVVLTRDRSYRKTPEKFQTIYKRMYCNYPHMIETIDNRHRIYNETLEYVRELEYLGKAVIIAPSTPVLLSRFERNLHKLHSLYEEGRRDALRALHSISLRTRK